MYTVLTITGSPAIVSRSSFLVEALEHQLGEAGISTRSLTVRDLPAQDLLHARFDSPAIVDVIKQFAAADAVVIATPIYKAAYSGILKALLDLLPQTALQGKVVLPLATGGSPAHFLAVDYALKPVLSALGARYVLSTVYATDGQIAGDAVSGYRLSDEVDKRLQTAAGQLIEGLDWIAHQRATGQAGTRQKRYA